MEERCQEFLHSGAMLWPEPPPTPPMRSVRYESARGAPRYNHPAPGGGSNVLIGGGGPLKRSISTRQSWPVQPCASREVPVSDVSTFGLPCTQRGASAAGSSGSYQAPVASWTTPGRNASLRTAPARQAPRSL